MNASYKIVFYVVGLFVLSVLVLMLGMILARQKTSLLPGDSSELNWFHSIEPAEPARENYVLVHSSGKESKVAEFSFHISPTQNLPYTSYTVYFSDPSRVEDLTDLSAYSTISFKIKCDPKNILVFALYSYVEGVTDISAPETYRVSSDFFTCNQQWREVNFPLRRLDSAIWWVERYGVKYSNLKADLHKVHGFAFNNSLQSPRGMDTNFSVKDLRLVRERAGFLYGSIAIIILLWFMGAIGLTRFYFVQKLKAAKSKINDNRPLIAYQQLSLKQKDESLKSKLLQHIAVEYCNPELNIESVVDLLGTNRIKINEILKAELGLTFTAYVNRLRLTEAARLLSLPQKLSVKQIAHEVGFANVTYFNTLFKKEYGCTPKAFANSGETK